MPILRVLMWLWDFYRDLRPSRNLCQKCNGAPTGSILEAILQVKKHSSAKTQRKSKPVEKAVNNTQTPSRFMASEHNCQFQNRNFVVVWDTLDPSETYSSGRMYMLKQIRIKIITENLCSRPPKKRWTLHLSWNVFHSMLKHFLLFQFNWQI